MKKILLVLTIILVGVGSSFAQDSTSNRGYQRGSKRAEMREQMQQQLKTQFNLTDSQAVAVSGIQQEYQMQHRQLKKNTSLNDEDRKAKESALEADRSTKLRAVLSQDQADKLEAMYAKLKKKKKASKEGREK